VKVFHVLFNQELEGVAGPSIAVLPADLEVVIVVEVVAGIGQGELLVRHPPI
jgi:hypothetical protein